MLKKKRMNSSLLLLSVPAIVLAAVACSHKEKKEATDTAQSASEAAKYRKIAYDIQRQYGGPPPVDPATGRPLTLSELVGRDVWYKAAAGNTRYNMYVFPQRVMGANVRWSWFLGTQNREKRFTKFGLMSDPDCVPFEQAGEKFKAEFDKFKAEKKRDMTRDDLYGFDYCPGDVDVLLAIGKPAGTYKDPGCEYNIDGNGHNACDLEMGTSTGVVGFRKLPNPRFNQAEWERKDSQGRTGWAKYGKIIKGAKDQNDPAMDMSLEAPFRVGISCASCHVAFNPAKPPANPNHPTWDNLSLTVGNQYLRNATLMASGADFHSIEWQIFRFDRPGTSDTSAAPNDKVYNPGTINAIINIPVRPRHLEHSFTSVQRAPGSATWDKVSDARIPKGPDGKEINMHILKGGEDSVGPAGAVQRVYINIGSCAEQCWLNHLDDLRVVSDEHRNFDQTPFSIDQCRRDCPNFRAIEERVGDVFAFLKSARPTDLKQAVQNEPLDDGKTVSEAKFKFWLQKRFNGNVDKGRQIFRDAGCISCHTNKEMVGDDYASNFDTATTPYNENHSYGSSLNTNALVSKIYAGAPDGVQEDVKSNWFGNDDITPATHERLGVYAGRALHSNHQKGHVWEEYASKEYHERTSQPFVGTVLEKYAKDGTGYYRNISLLNVWAYAPFLHNNALGPEICSAEKVDPLYPSPYRDEKGVEAQGAPACVKFPYKVADRLKVFEDSMREMFLPNDKRWKKISRTDQDVFVPIVPGFRFGRVLEGKSPITLPRLKIPAGTPVALLGSFKFKEFIADFAVWWAKPESFAAYASQKRKFSDDQIKALTGAFAGTLEKLKKGEDAVADLGKIELYSSLYSNAPFQPENIGHVVDLQGLLGQDGLDRLGLTKEQAENSLIAFLATL